MVRKAHRLKLVSMAVLLAFAQSPARAANSSDLQGFEFSYRVAGTGTIRPIQVFDDGRLTYFQFRDTHNLPAIILAGPRPLPMAYAVRGSYVVVRGVHDHYLLRQGNERASVDRTVPTPYSDDETAPLPGEDPGSGQIVSDTGVSPSPTAVYAPPGNPASAQAAPAAPPAPAYPPQPGYAPSAQYAPPGPAGAYVRQQGAAYGPPAQYAPPQQATYAPQTPAYAPPQQPAYTPPAPAYAPPQQPAYAPPATAYAPPQQAAYAPSAPRDYAPSPQQPAYAPPAQYYPQQQSGYAPPAQYDQQQGTAEAPAAYDAPQFHTGAPDAPLQAVPVPAEPEQQERAGQPPDQSSENIEDRRLRVIQNALDLLAAGKISPELASQIIRQTSGVKVRDAEGVKAASARKRIHYARRTSRRVAALEVPYAAGPRQVTTPLPVSYIGRPVAEYTSADTREILPPGLPALTPAPGRYENGMPAAGGGQAWRPEWMATRPLVMNRTRTMSPEEADTAVQPYLKPRYHFEVAANDRLSEALRRLVEQDHWRLEWLSDKDYNVLYPYSISGDSLDDVLKKALAGYGLTATLYSVNRVIVIRPAGTRSVS